MIYITEIKTVRLWQGTNSYYKWLIVLLLRVKLDQLNEKIKKLIRYASDLVEVRVTLEQDLQLYMDMSK